MRKILLSVAAVSMLMMACSKDDKNDNGGGNGNGNGNGDGTTNGATTAGSSYVLGILEPANYNQYISKIIGQDNDTTWISYDANNRVSLVHEKYTKGQVTISLMTPTYTDGKLVSHAQTYNNEPKQLDRGYTYDAKGKVQKILYYEDGAWVYAYDSIAYNAAGKIEASYYYIKQSKTDPFYQAGKDVATYDAKGNITKIEEYWRTSATAPQNKISTNNLEYDEKPNAFLPILLHYDSFDLSRLSLHNVTKQTILDEKGAVSDLITFAYEYDAAGFPIKMTVNELDKNTQATTYTSVYTLSYNKK
ncbi:hypothetical protein LX64_03800 [Chitinophaga skermanii]|uniref:YD repeat-containing protein n=1 Tax=Chitinophaga skermanii TaxID=331697 RepID=A0A327QCL8_9BACT|nr:hypothetical protein [Chitinophaga skermanii]RAJ01584.1 hypothetical protein LX64_03800 [Chitinophaga skermanii]